MTVPGRGGRPRKWLSDADRVRAHRARQRGEAEPQIVEVARRGDDAIAAAVERQNRLEALLSDACDEVKQLRRDLIATETSVDRLQGRIDVLESERVLLGQVAELNERTQAHWLEQDTFRQQAAAPNRAARRRAAQRRN